MVLLSVPPERNAPVAFAATPSIMRPTAASV
jgi:hypothetical protein